MAAEPKRKSSLARIAGGSHPSGQLDRLIHERVRLGIVSALAAHDVQTFIELKQALGLTDGNL